MALKIGFSAHGFGRCSFQNCDKIVQESRVSQWSPLPFFSSMNDMIVVYAMRSAFVHLFVEQSNNWKPLLLSRLNKSIYVIVPSLSILSVISVKMRLQNGFSLHFMPIFKMRRTFIPWCIYTDDDDNIDGTTHTIHSTQNQLRRTTLHVCAFYYSLQAGRLP